MDFSTDEEQVIHPVRLAPCVSLILPFETKISQKEELEHKLKLTLQELERKLLEDYTEDKCRQVMSRLETLLRTTDFTSDKKSIAIYASPVLAKVFYLDFPVEPKMIIDESFEIRDLVYSKQAAFKFLLVKLSSRHAEVFLAANHHLVKLKLNQAGRIEAYERDLPEQVFNFSDAGEENEKLLQKFLRRVDEGLLPLVRAYNLPLFVLAPEKVASLFQHISRHHQDGMVYGNFERATDQEVLAAVQPAIRKYKNRQTEKLKEQIANTLEVGRLVAGVASVWTAAKDKLGKLLIVERNFMAPAEHTDKEHFIRTHDPEDGGLYIKDAVDDIIEMVLDSGGEVAFVDDGELNDYMHIALILYY